MWVYAYTCMCLYVCMSVLWHACLSPNLSLTRVPQGNWPTPDPVLHCLALQSLLQKRMRMGAVFHPCGGQSVRIHQPSLGSSTLGSDAQQAPSSPQDKRPLNWSQTPEMCLCLASVRGYWWLTLSLCLWTCQSWSIALLHHDWTAMLCIMSLKRHSVAICKNMCFEFLLLANAWEDIYQLVPHICPMFFLFFFYNPWSQFHCQSSLLNPGHSQLKCPVLVQHSNTDIPTAFARTVLCIAVKNWHIPSCGPYSSPLREHTKARCETKAAKESL